MRSSPRRDDDAFQRARALHGASDHAGALALYRTASRGRRDDPELLYLIGSCLLQLGRYGEARTSIARAVMLAPRVPEFHHELALTYQGDGRFEEALASFDRGLALKPGHPALAAGKADLLRARGELEAAWAVLEPVLAKADPGPAARIACARLAGRIGRASEGIDAARAVAGDDTLPPGVRARGWFALGDLLDRAGEYDDAFAAYERGNRLRARPHDPDAFSAAIDALIAGWSAASMAVMAPGRGTGSDRCIFIVGMPRSGTTLVEQILAAHPAVRAFGELAMLHEIATELGGSGAAGPMVTDPSGLDVRRLDRIAGRYLRGFGRVPPAIERVTDKAPDNLAHVGLIARALPGAVVLRCERDPRDTCLSCYFQPFRGAYPYAWDLAHLGRACRDMARLAAHWQAVLADPPVVVSYEGLVADREPAMRAIIAAAGLGWDAACLRFHEADRTAMTLSNEQVRQPLYASSVGRWRHYQRHIGPLVDALGDLAV